MVSGSPEIRIKDEKLSEKDAGVLMRIVLAHLKGFSCSLYGHSKLKTLD